MVREACRDGLEITQKQPAPLLRKPQESQVICFQPASLCYRLRGRVLKFVPQPPMTWTTAQATAPEQIGTMTALKVVTVLRIHLTTGAFCRSPHEYQEVV
jgi:hypothetical protein